MAGQAIFGIKGCFVIKITFNPCNPIKIAAATFPVFKAGKAFKEAVNAKPAKKKAAKKGE